MSKKRNRRDNRETGKRNGILVFVLLLVVAFSFRLAVARFLANDTPDDGKVYAQIARNLLEQHVYSHETEAPYAPTLIRLPGYPLLLAGIYSLFGHNDNAAVRTVQALIDTATCGLIALVAFQWEPDGKRKRSSSIAALALAAVCPFTTIYVATILTETSTMFLAVAAALTATLALKTNNQKTLWLWLATGLLAGVAVLFRPDSGLFALAIGITLVIGTLGRAGDVKLSTRQEEKLFRTARASYLGAVFSLAFCLVLVPWAVRNYRVFHFFQPLAPAHAEMPGEFVPRGYLTWVRSWLDDSRYIGPALWSLDSAPIKLADIPERAFDSAEEKSRVGELLEKYNHAHDEPLLFTDQPDVLSPEAQSTEEPDKKENENPQSGETDQPDDENASDEGAAEESDEEDDKNATADQASDQTVGMTPEIDAGFSQLARERIARHPFRYYVLLPLRRAHSLWFNTHSDYYPFEGELLPLADLDYDIQQQYWLPLFAFLALAYSLLGIAGGWTLWQSLNFDTRLWLLLAALMIFL
ncbi:MAG TPA: glycosyltransferase family 39 protein, partial [Pyrinomonadaceae bacterium]|nr:glycosyltransferase family 39 protein [Pyrinomonadaceae bacterium]